jgi:hypothetical protein
MRDAVAEAAPSRNQVITKRLHAGHVKVGREHFLTEVAPTLLGRLATRRRVVRRSFGIGKVEAFYG